MKHTKTMAKLFIPVLALGAIVGAGLAQRLNQGLATETLALPQTGASTLVLGGHAGYTAKLVGGTTVDIKYENLPAEEYANLWISLPSNPSYRELEFSLENLGASSTNVRIDVIGSGSSVVTSAVVDNASLGIESGHTKYDIASGASKNVKIRYSETATAVQLFVDSAIWQDPEESHTGHITFGNLRFLDTNKDFLFEWKDAEYAAFPAFSDVANIRYETMTRCWHAVGMLVPEGHSEDRRIAFDVKNNTNRQTCLRVNVLNGSDANCEGSIAKNGAVDPSKTDKVNGGSYIYLDAYEEANIVLNYTAAAVKYSFMLDSSWEDKDYTNGSVTLSNLNFGYDRTVFARDLLKLTRGLCNSSYDGVTNNETSLTAIWKNLKSTSYYDGLSAADQTALASAAGDSAVVVPTTLEGIENMSDEDAVKAAMYRYDYCTAKYGLENFIADRTAPAYVTSAVKLAMQDNTGVILTITLVAVAIVATSFIVFGLKKRHN